jgi:hypothetical protein
MHEPSAQNRRFTPSPSMAVALAALFVALGGTGYAAVVAANSVNSRSIVDRSVQKVDIANGAVTNAKLANSAVNSTKVADGSLAAADLSTAAKSAIRDTKWALVAANGTVIKTNAGVTASTSTTGEYLVNFNTPTAGKLVIASLSERDNTAQPFAIQASPCGVASGATSDTYTNCSNIVFKNSVHVLIKRSDTNVFANNSFYVALMP